MARKSAGFFRMAPESPQRRWCFTLFDFDTWGAAAEAAWPLEGLRYLVAQPELCPDTGRRHWQGYVEARRPLRFGGFGRRWPELWPSRTHWERARGSREQCRDYCRKEDTRDPDGTGVELGEFGGGGQGRRSDLAAIQDTVRSLASAGATAGQVEAELYEKHFSATIRYDRALVRYVSLQTRRPRGDPPRVAVYQGATGTGKTRRFYDEEEDHWRAPPATAGSQLWFDGYRGQRAVLFDDYDGRSVKLPLMLQLLDRYPLDVPVKGGFTHWTPRTIVFTTNIPIDRWYDGETEAHRAALERRITEVWSFEQGREPERVENWRVFYRDV